MVLYMKKIYIDNLGLINPNRMSTGNRKIVDTLIFNLPAGNNGTCNQTCIGCYALKAERLYPNTREQRRQNLFLYQKHRDTLLSLLLTQLTYSDLQVVRVHESGDFFSSDYVQFWVDIALLFPDKIFYTYTKSIENFDNVPRNFNVLNSWIDTERTIPNYGTLDECKEWMSQGFYVCPASEVKSVKCNLNCFYCHTQKKVCFVKH